MRSDEVAPETWAIVGGRPHDHPGAPLNVPMVPASNFIHGTERIYSRNEATEGWEAFEAVVGGLEGGDAVAFASGMGACAAVLGQLPQGARLVLGDDCYQGVAELAEIGARDRGWQVERLPVADERWVRAETTTLVVQINGKVRDRIDVPVDISEDDAIAAALASARVVELLAGAEPRRVVARPPKLVNIVR